MLFENRYTRSYIDFHLWSFFGLIFIFLVQLLILAILPFEKKQNGLNSVASKNNAGVAILKFGAVHFSIFCVLIFLIPNLFGATLNPISFPLGLILGFPLNVISKVFHNEWFIILSFPLNSLVWGASIYKLQRWYIQRFSHG